MITYAMTMGVLNNFLAAVAWFMLDKYERRPVGDLSDLDYMVGEVKETGEVVVTFGKQKE